MLDNVPQGCGYENRYKYVWQTKQNGLMGSDIQTICENVNGKWGWHFVKRGDYATTHFGPYWYKSSWMCLSFEDQDDLITMKLILGEDY